MSNHRTRHGYPVRIARWLIVTLIFTIALMVTFSAVAVWG